MINDLATLAGNSSDLRKFADDTTVSEIISKTERSGLQEQLDQLNYWSKENHFQFDSIGNVRSFKYTLSPPHTRATC
jgi:hypothetical protein